MDLFKALVSSYSAVFTFQCSALSGHKGALRIRHDIASSRWFRFGFRRLAVGRHAFLETLSKNIVRSLKQCLTFGGPLRASD